MLAYHREISDLRSEIPENKKTEIQI